jgi:hypothetical protein
MRMRGKHAVAAVWGTPPHLLPKTPYEKTVINVGHNETNLEPYSSLFI